MARITITGMAGIAPNISKSRLPSNFAQQAKNCQLGGGLVRPWRTPQYEARPGGSSALKTIYLFGGSLWFASTARWSIVRGPIAGDTTERTYYTGDGQPKVTDNTLADLGGGGPYPESSYFVGVPAPTNGPNLTINGASGGGSPETRAYLYTWVNGWGEEGPPSPATTTASTVEAGQTVTVDTFDAAPNGYNIAYVNIYRTVVGSSGASYEFVHQITVGTTSYTDNVAAANLGEVLPSSTWWQPPTDLFGLIELPNGGMAGVSGNQVCLCEQYQPGAWPLANRYPIQSTIVGIGNYDTTIVACTSTIPYRIVGVRPDSRDTIPINESQPCMSARGIVSFDTFVMYPSSNGLFYVGVNGSRLVTSDLFTPNQWASLNPDTMRAINWNGLYVCFYQTGTQNNVSIGGAIIFDPNNNQVGIAELDFCADALHVDQTGNGLFYAIFNKDVAQNEIRQFNAGVGNMTATWRSKEFLSMDELNWAYIKVIASYSAGLTDAELVALNADRTRIIAENGTAIANGLVGGAINEKAINERPINGDDLQAVPNAVQAGGPSSVVVSLYEDGDLIDTLQVPDSEPYPLVAERLVRATEVEVAANCEVEEIRVATSLEEMAQ